MQYKTVKVQPYSYSLYRYHATDKPAVEVNEIENIQNPMLVKQYRKTIQKNLQIILILEQVSLAFSKK